MGLPAGTRHEVAVVRVEVRDADDAKLLIELLEVGRERGRDRLLGRATNVMDACRILEDWLVALAGGLDRPSAGADNAVPDG